MVETHTVCSELFTGNLMQNRNIPSNEVYFWEQITTDWGQYNTEKLATVVPVYPDPEKSGHLHKVRHQAMVPNRIPFTYVEYISAIYGHLHILKPGRSCVVLLH